MWNKITGLVGPSGSGKSHEAALLMSKAQRAAVYQIVREDSNYLGSATDVIDGNIRQFCRNLGTDEFRLVYRVASGARRQDGNRIVFPDFELFIACCFERREMLMLIDEAHFLCNPRYIPVFFWESIVTGRHAYLDIAYVTQRFSMVHHDLTANTHEFIFWRINEPADLDAIEKRCGTEVRERVANLRRAIDNRSTGGEFIPGENFVWNANTGETTNAEEKSTGTNNGNVQHMSSNGDT